MDLTLRLPDEILTHVIENTHHRSTNAHNGPDFARLPSFLVCRRWYSVAIGSPIYWQHIAVGFPAAFNHIENFLLRLERSSRRPVDVTFWGQTWPDLTTMDLDPLKLHLMPALTSHLGHIRSLKISRL